MAYLSLYSPEAYSSDRVNDKVQFLRKGVRSKKVLKEWNRRYGCLCSEVYGVSLRRMESLVVPK